MTMIMALRSIKQCIQYYERKLCDVTIYSGNKKIEAHRIILAACSPYFCALFTSNLIESGQASVTLHEIDADALEVLIHYAYTAEVEISEANVQALLPAASLLLLHDVRENCCEFLLSKLHPSNCLGFRRFADVHSCHDLKVKAHNFALGTFTEVVEFEEFLNLPLSEICELVSDDGVRVACEEQIFEAVLKWVQHDIAHRSVHMAELFRYIRLPLLPKEYLVNLVESELLNGSNLECKDFLIEAMKFHLLPNHRRVSYRSPRTRPRKFFSSTTVMYVIGGQAPKALKGVERFDRESNSWTDVAPMTSRRCRAGVAVVDGLIYAVGGFNGSLRVRTVDSYDPIKDLWQPVASMELRRSTLGVAELNGSIYAIGGFDGATGLNSAECFNVITNCWKNISPMNTRRSSVGVASLNRYIYAVGGYDGSSRQCLNSVEQYDPALDEWRFVREMKVRRSGAGVAVLDGLLYAVGGHDGPDVRKSVEFYDPATNEWTEAAEMNLCRRNAAVTTVEGLLYVFGGDDGSKNLNSVEFYDPFCNKWTLSEESLGTGRSYAGAATLQLPRHLSLPGAFSSDCESSL
ncbi:uncharacterized protein TRIADDRAFT_50655 [Trichoplax adhaerens]|uniref:BTB domain-containing protein n=1 Tax=Trichoplax adhaerens TaxID=10228 RepID=B3S4N8_TRIAD|nr:hypothetical protein TRIADDRAFT_50655 [Trichoplax adhaerens]EDV22500.1 hypothetical protein TRIADDRAFT_50655 [Trichoplax adhaerens]|eukprot:XP_002115044.1 hypothetical protein TRIADDRAFT_50655 [Trichoplax adhaerens]